MAGYRDCGCFWDVGIYSGRTFFPAIEARFRGRALGCKAMDWVALFNPGFLIFAVPVLYALGWIVSMILKHRERMAMIERGMDPRLLGEKDSEHAEVEKRR